MIQEREEQGSFIFGRDGDTFQGVDYVHLTGGKSPEDSYDIRHREVQEILATDQF